MNGHRYAAEGTNFCVIAWSRYQRRTAGLTPTPLGTRACHQGKRVLRGQPMTGIVDTKAPRAGSMSTTLDGQTLAHKGAAIWRYSDLVKAMSTVAVFPPHLAAREIYFT